MLAIAPLILQRIGRAHSLFPLSPAPGPIVGGELRPVGVAIPTAVGRGVAGTRCPPAPRLFPEHLAMPLPVPLEASPIEVRPLLAPPVHPSARFVRMGLPHARFAAFAHALQRLAWPSGWERFRENSARDFVSLQ